MRHLSCPACQTSNALDSLFCRACGTALPDDIRQALKAENMQLLQDGQRLLVLNRGEEARKVAESILEVEPENADAMALLGDAYERDGMLEDALATYERVVELRPDSPLDRIRAAQIGKTLAARQLAVEAPRERRNLVGAAAMAILLLFSVGAALTIASRPAAQETPSNTTPETTGPTAFRSVAPVPTGPETTAAPQAQTPAPGTSGLVASNTPNPPSAAIQGPLGGRSTPTNDPGYAPLSPNMPVNVSPSGAQPTAPVTQPQPEIPAPSNTTAESGGTPAEAAAQDDPGSIEIRVHPGARPAGNNPGSEQPASGSVDNLIRQARDLYTQGKFSDAARLYETALQRGASKGSTNQRLAQCYEKLGRRADAVAAYQRAIAAYESQINAGQGSARIQAALETCRAALRALGA